ncbi:thiamine-phosphate diphosphorylase [Roseateles sp. YR242]|uniref:bifunctional hydroxymethylpyrimidine kinase/phosphomethylpyrimidine kinase n=1 Tax=Roseateles sp. YR242 TaxID=1855305 RepID=UPI0008B82467|nr:bifunctional hydroxymethylpyrimidine kinase/phosphomethylpyrimidine kinase [Roseateles sp. YR242]SEK68059.1 thiamine-phosphate diphosphorylase [Roseateles sp. YR242]
MPMRRAVFDINDMTARATPTDLPRLWPHPSLPSPWAGTVDPWQESLTPWAGAATPAVVWSVAGTDSGGGAGLAADTRAASAMGVHLCTVVAAITAQNSMGVQAVHPVAAAALRAQLQALRADLPARVIKTGLLASAAAVDVLLAQREDACLVVDPVLGASAGGAAFCDDALLAAYRHQLLPQAALVTPNRREAERLLGVAAGQCGVPELARRLRQLGAQAVCITGGDDTSQGTALALDWLDSPMASGWIALPRLTAEPGQALHHHGSGCTFATAAAAALARGFPVPDAVILAKMLAWTALRDGHAAGAGAGPLRPSPAFINDPAALPVMGQADEEVLSDLLMQRWTQALQQRLEPAQHKPLQPSTQTQTPWHPPSQGPSIAPSQRGSSADFRPGLYAITDQSARIPALAASGHFAHIQLRIKQAAKPAQGDSAPLPLRDSIRAALGAVEGLDTTLWINDHWRLALEEGARALHLGQEDWTTLTLPERHDLWTRCQAGMLKLGLSSHSLWELCRARAVSPTYIACGPVWPTTTKDMPWLPQGLAQLRWWARMAGRPVVAIGGILAPSQVEAAQRAGASAVCLVRAAERWMARPAATDPVASPAGVPDPWPTYE